jgi:hypothetical protein
LNPEPTIRTVPRFLHWLPYRILYQRESKLLAPQLSSFEDFRRKPQRKPYQPFDRSTNQNKFQPQLPIAQFHRNSSKILANPKAFTYHDLTTCKARFLPPHTFPTPSRPCNHRDKHPLTQDEWITLPRMAAQRCCSTQESTDRRKGGEKGRESKSPCTRRARRSSWPAP